MDDAALRLAIGDLNAAYADCIDDDRLEEWPDFFVEDCRYLITDRSSHEAGLRHGDARRQHLRAAPLSPPRWPGPHRPGGRRCRRGAGEFHCRAYHAQWRQPAL